MLDMKKFLCLLIFVLLSGETFALPCRNEAQLRELDRRYENAILVSDADTLEKLLDDKYIWVHNQVSMIETKRDLITRVSDDTYAPPLSRKSSYQRASRRDGTWVLMGVTEVNQAKPIESNPNNIRMNRYFFTKTYVNTGRYCRLISSMTTKMEAIDISADS
ncbi:MAG: nuclear transport factor 2 family protein [Cellvibrionaceae bacterium]|nr:nuclear transport factor 2 family protein [Cellvibrionaceae bacterium]